MNGLIISVTFLESSSPVYSHSKNKETGLVNMEETNFRRMRKIYVILSFFIFSPIFLSFYFFR